MTPLMVRNVCIGLLVIILIWDLFLYKDSVKRNSISQVVIDYSKKYPMLPAIIGFSMGLLIGHWYG